MCQCWKSICISSTFRKYSEYLFYSLFVTECQKDPEFISGPWCIPIRVLFLKVSLDLALSEETAGMGEDLLQELTFPLLLLCPCECRLETPQVTRRTATCRRARGSARPGGERVRAGEKQRTQCLLCACWLPGALQVSVPSSSQQKGIGVVIFYPTLQRQQRG